MIFVKIHGMNGICMTESSRRDFIHKITSQLQKSSVDSPKDIFLSFSGDHVTDGEGNPSNFCIIHTGRTASIKDLNLLIKILKHESVLGDHIMLSTLEPIPKK